MDTINDTVNHVLSSTARHDPNLEYAIDNEFVKLPRFRLMDDFLLNSSRYSLPTHGNSDRLHNRMINNLLYYQTNYLAVFAAVFLVIFYLQSKAILLGLIFFAGVFYGVHWFLQNREVFREIRNERKPTLMILGILLWLAFMHFLGAIAIFTFGLCFPLALCLIHSALRMRNTRNKLNTAKCITGLKQTPAGIVLGALGYMDNLRIF